MFAIFAGQGNPAQTSNPVRKSMGFGRRILAAGGHTVRMLISEEVHC